MWYTINYLAIYCLEHLHLILYIHIGDITLKFSFKKVNRGLLLGAIVLILLILYLIAEHISFTNKKTQIRSVVENYITELEHLNESAVSLNEALPSLETYWTTGSTTLSCNWTNMAMALHSVFSNNRSQIIHTESTLGQYQITQSGTKGAILECTYSFTADIQEANMYLLVCEAIPLSDSINTTASLHRWAGTIQITVDMVYENHTWVIAGIDTSVLEETIQPVTE